MTKPHIKIFIGTLCVLLSSCSKTTEWQEEVMLSNGTTIQIERKTLLNPGGAEIATGSGYSPSKYIIKMEYPFGSNHYIEWASHTMPATLHPEFPLVLDVQSGDERPYMITIGWASDSCYEYMKYEYIGDQWKQQKLPEAFHVMETNLYLGSARSSISKHIGLAQKRELLAKGRYSSVYKTVGPKRTGCSL